MKQYRHNTIKNPQKTIACLLLACQLLTSCGIKEEMIVPSSASDAYQEDVISSLSSTEEVAAPYASQQSSSNDFQEYSVFSQPTKKTLFDIHRQRSNSRSHNISRRNNSKFSWQKVALVGMALYNTFAYASRPSVLQKKHNQHLLNSESDGISSTYQDYSKTIQSDIERRKEEREREINIIVEAARKSMELSDKLRKESYKRLDAEMKEARESWKIANEKEAARIALIEAQGFSQVFNILGVIITCSYDRDVAQRLLTEKNIPNDSDNVAHLASIEICKIDNPTDQSFEFGILQKVLPGTYVQALDTVKNEEIVKFKIKTDMIDVTTECAIDSSGKRACEEDGLLFYGHTDIRTGTNTHYYTQELKPKQSYTVYFHDIPRYRCITTFDKKALLQDQANGVDRFNGKKSHYTGLGLTGGASVELDVRERGDECYPEGSSIKTTVEYKFANIMALRDISHGGDWQFSEKEMRWVGENTCAYDGSTSSYKSPDTLVKETDLREIDNTRDTYHSLSSLEVADDYLDTASRLLSDQTGQDSQCQQKNAKDELLQINQENISLSSFWIK